MCRITNLPNTVPERPPHGQAKANGGWFPSRARRIKRAIALKIIGSGGISRECSKDGRQHPLIAVNHRRVNNDGLKPLTHRQWKQGDFDLILVKK